MSVFLLPALPPACHRSILGKNACDNQEVLGTERALSTQSGTSTQHTGTRARVSSTLGQDQETRRPGGQERALETEPADAKMVLSPKSRSQEVHFIHLFRQQALSMALLYILDHDRTMPWDKGQQDK